MAFSLLSAYLHVLVAADEEAVGARGSVCVAPLHAHPFEPHAPARAHGALPPAADKVYTREQLLRCQRLHFFVLVKQVN